MYEGESNENLKSEGKEKKRRKKKQENDKAVPNLSAIYKL
jgi:hypothetical protein